MDMETLATELIKNLVIITDRMLSGVTPSAIPDYVETEFESGDVMAKIRVDFRAAQPAAADRDPGAQPSTGDEDRNSEVRGG